MAVTIAQAGKTISDNYPDYQMIPIMAANNFSTSLKRIKSVTAKLVFRHSSSNNSQAFSEKVFISNELTKPSNWRAVTNNGYAYYVTGQSPYFGISNVNNYFPNANILAQGTCYRTVPNTGNQTYDNIVLTVNNSDATAWRNKTIYIGCRNDGSARLNQTIWGNGTSVMTLTLEFYPEITLNKVSVGSTITAAQINELIKATNTVMTTYGKTGNIATISTGGLITTTNAKLTEIRNALGTVGTKPTFTMPSGTITAAQYNAVVDAIKSA